jgi:hypothetical protein
MKPADRAIFGPEVEVREGLMLPDLEKIMAADRQGKEMVVQAQQEALDLKSQADARVRESQTQLQEDLAQVRQGAQAEILAAAEARAGEIAGATAGQVQVLTEDLKTRQAEAVAWLVSRVLGT